MQPTLPEAEYPFAVRVPKAGASCKTCVYLGANDQCRNSYYIEWNNGSRELGAKPKRWCCSAWTEA